MNGFSNKQQADYTRTLQKGIAFVRSFHGRLTGDINEVQDILAKYAD